MAVGDATGGRAAVPRTVVVTRPSDYETLIERHATRGQAAFFLESHGQSIEPVEDAHRAFQAALARVTASIPSTWPRQRVSRRDLDRFVFEPRDVVVVVGQDGLVANVAKYLEGQPVIGVNPLPGHFDGVLVPHRPEDAAALLAAAAAGRAPVERRTMVCASLDDGQRLLALNEIFLGHASHQSARYEIGFGEARERQSSSGLIVATGTGATGWARSIHRACQSRVALPGPTEEALAFLVREAFPSGYTGTEVVAGRFGAGQALRVRSEMNDGGVIFGDGIEQDRLDFGWGQRAEVRAADSVLCLVRG